MIRFGLRASSVRSSVHRQIRKSSLAPVRGEESNRPVGCISADMFAVESKGFDAALSGD